MKNKKSRLDETVDRMRQLYEYSFYHGTTEADDNQQQQPAQDGGMGGDPNAGMGGDPNMGMGGDPNMGMGGDPMGGGMGMDPNADMGGDPNADMGGDPNAGMGGDPNAGMGGDPNAGGVNGADLAPNAGMDGEDPMGEGPLGGDMGDEQPGPDDDVIDVTQLTDTQNAIAQGQDEIGGQIDDVNGKLSTLVKIVDKFTKALDANDEKLKELKREIVKRNPTDEETMNVRLYAGGNPFSEKPGDFWDRFKDINNHYNITANNDAPQYQIRKGDIDNYNEHLVADEFDDIPDSLKEYFVR